MTPDEFRDAGHLLIDWIADHRASVSERAVRSTVAPGEVGRALGGSIPTGGETIGDLLRDLDNHVLPGVSQVQHPANFAWFPANATLSSVLGDIACAGIGALGITWQSAPALTEVETLTCDWLRELCGLSDQWSGVIQDTASSATLVALLSAREQAIAGSGAQFGLQGRERPLVVYASDQAHSSVAKAARLAGFGEAWTRLLPTDPADRSLRPETLAEAMAADAAEGRVPAAVVACVGTTGTAAIDPVADLVAVARQHEAWVHVDAAMAGTALLVPECRHLFDGIEGADSISWNPHKWMGTILDCSMYLVRDTEHLTRVMGTNPSYLKGRSDEVTEYKDWGIPLGRRFRSLKLLFQLRLDGPEEIRARVRRDLANAAWLAEQVRATPGWRVVAPVALQTVCVRHHGGDGALALADLDAHTLAWCEAVNASGAAMITPSLLDNQWMVRVSIGALDTDRAEVEVLWQLMREAAEPAD